MGKLEVSFDFLWVLLLKLAGWSSVLGFVDPGWALSVSLPSFMEPLTLQAD